MNIRAILGLLIIGNVAFGQAPHHTSIQPLQVQEDIPINRGSAALWQSLKKLHTRASLVMVVAHPDDEDSSTLAYESRGRGSRVTLLTLNRGEGGANVMSGDFFDALGLVRTMELLKAGQYYGVDQYWTRLIDYGFSKTKEESIGQWTHKRTLYDVVRIVRTVRPLVVSSVFVGGPSDGHGNHQTAGAMAKEVFEAAGNPDIFPEQIQAGLRPWNPLKGYARVPFRRRSGGTPPKGNVNVPHGTYDPVLGASYTQIAREGLGYQKSQVGGPSIPKLGESTTAYERYGSKVPAQENEASFFEGIDVSLQGIATLAKDGDVDFLRAGLSEINGYIETAIQAFNSSAPEASAKPLAAGLKATLQLIDAVTASNLSVDAKYDIQHELKIKRVQFNNALIESLGLTVYGTSVPDGEQNPFLSMFFGDAETPRIAIPGQKLSVNVRAVNTNSTEVKLEKISVEAYQQKQTWDVQPSSDLPSSVAIPQNKPIESRFEVHVPENADFTRPYFLRPDIEQPFYNIADEEFLYQPLSPYPLAAWADFSFDGVQIRVGQVVQTIKRVAGLGAVYEPLVVGPAISVAITPRAGVVPLSAKSFKVTASIHSNVKGQAKGNVKLDLPQGWSSEPASIPVETSADGESLSVSFTVTPGKIEQKPYEISAVVNYNGKEYKEGYEVTGYEELRPYYLYRSSTYRTTGVDVKIADHLKVAYIVGTGDDVPSSLEHLGIKVSFLSPADVANGDLQTYDMVVLGVRTYAARQELKTYNSRLLNYVKEGGVLMVQYNTPEYNNSYGPFSYDMGPNPEEVTDEKSEVKILNPEHPAFNWPNQITVKDFDHWVEQRGSKWLKTWDPNYEALLETRDEGQEPQRGGLLYAKYGKGIYIYNAYAFYRQLPEGVPGAYRIFANLLSLPKNPRIR